MTTDQRRVHQCATMTVHKRLVDENPENYIENRKQIERLSSAHITQTSRAGLRTGLATICCVVHVVYSSPEQNISDQQINSQSEVSIFAIGGWIRMLKMCHLLTHIWVV